MKFLARSLSLLLLGAVLGGGVTYTAFRYHVVQARDGWHVISSGTPAPTACYADIRNWTAGDWANHPQLAAALVENGHADLVLQGAVDDLAGRLLQRR